MKYIVPKGKHYSRLHKWLPFTIPRIFKHTGYHLLSCDIEITESMFYDSSSLGEDDKDVNKIIGFGRGYHMNNSARLGFNCIDGKLRFYAFTHDGGIQYRPELKIDKEFKVGDKLHLMIIDDHNKISYYLGNGESSVELTHKNKLDSKEIVTNGLTILNHTWEVIKKQFKI